MTDSEILLALNSILSPYQTKVVKAGPKVDKIRIISAQRGEDQSNISKQLKSKKINYKNEIDKSESSFPVTKIILPKSNSMIKLIYKKSGGGGSGAGAALTKLTECAQALYAALVFNVLKREMTINDVTKDNFVKAMATTSIDTSFQSILNDLPDDWINSSIAGANSLFRKFRGKANFTFHRGSTQVNLIESTFTRINKEERAFGNLNKWSPADIYMISNSANLNQISGEATLKGLNIRMFELIKNSQVIGVSLKKIVGGAAAISQKNFPTDTRATKAKYRGMTTNLDAMDGYIQWGSSPSEKIQFRSFGGESSLSGWQGEIKGTSANQGKISLGPINFILKRHGLRQIPTSTQSATLATKNSIEHCRTIAEMMARNGVVSGNQIEEVAKSIQLKSNKYRYSKYLVMKLFEIFSTMPANLKDEVVQDFYLYASSQAVYSAPYYKME
jgi:hypothetical protein